MNPTAGGTRMPIDRSRPGQQPWTVVILPLVTSLTAVGLFLVPVASVEFWTLDYILFLAFVLTIPIFLIRGKGWAVRVVVTASVLAYVVFNQARAPRVPQPLEIALLVLGVIVSIVPGHTQLIRSLVLVLALVYFGFLQAACPRLPGAFELVIVHAFDGRSILMHVIKIGAIVALGVVFGRYYCGWICPKGALQEYLFRPALAVTVPPRLDQALKWGKYLTLAALVFYALVWHDQLFRYIGPFRVAFNLGGPTYLVLWLAVVLTASIFVERAYCRYFCPEGGLLALAQLFSLYRVRIDRDACACCDRCAKACPVGAIMIDTHHSVRVSRTECIACARCETACGDDSLSYGFRLKCTASQEVPNIEAKHRIPDNSEPKEGPVTHETANHLNPNSGFFGGHALHLRRPCLLHFHRPRGCPC